MDGAQVGPTRLGVLERRRRQGAFAPARRYPNIIVSNWYYFFFVMAWLVRATSSTIVPRLVARILPRDTGHALPDAHTCWPMECRCREPCPKPYPAGDLRSAASKRLSPPRQNEERGVPRRSIAASAVRVGQNDHIIPQTLYLDRSAHSHHGGGSKRSHLRLAMRVRAKMGKQTFACHDRSVHTTADITARIALLCQPAAPRARRHSFLLGAPPLSLVLSLR